MIAVACAKGGSGKTTTTLGLAKAIASHGEPSLAIDGNAQLSDLHVTAGIDGEPTIADVKDESNWESVAQPLPGKHDANVLPGPKPSQSVDIKSKLEKLNRPSVEVLVDCPSGAGPDLVDPISAADGVVITTTEQQQSVEAARTTIDVANRLEVPVEGVVVVKTDDVGEEFRSKFDQPVLGAVPDRDPPLRSPDVMESYQRIADRLFATDEIDTVSVDKVPEDVLETGVDAIDGALGGGFRGGNVVAMTADPASQAELFLHELTDSRGTLYLTTQRSDDVVRQAMTGSSVSTGTPTIRHLDEDPITEAKELVEKLPDGSNVVIDVADALEREPRSEYVGFLNELKRQMVEKDSLALLHCLDRPSPPEGRACSMHFADAVIEVETVGDGFKVRNELSLSKLRSNRRATAGE
jgi:cellulose biosynthesis protein BcsQ